MTHPCDDCRCTTTGQGRSVASTVRHQGLVALVMDAPNSTEAIGRSVFTGPAGEILLATIRSVIASTGEEVPKDIFDRVAVFHAVTKPTPGGKPPKISAIRECAPRLLAELDAARPAMVLSLGAAACAALSGTGKATPITKWRGQMRWLDLPGGRVPWVASISPGSVAARKTLYRDLAFDVLKALTQRAPLPDPNVERHVPRDFEALRGAMALLDDASVVSCDVETTGLRPYRDRLISVGFGADYGDNSGISVVVPLELLSDQRVLDLCWGYVYRATRRTVGQNFKFDMQFLSMWFGQPGAPDPIPLDSLMGDTLLLGFLLDERPRKDRIGSLGLKEQASYRYDKEDYHWDWSVFYADMAHDGTYPKGGSSRESEACDAKCKYPHPDDVTRADWEGLYEYHGYDVYFTAKLWFDLVDEANAESPRLLEAHDQVLMPAAKILAACELAGAPLNHDWLVEFSAWLHYRIDRRRAALTAGIARIGTVNDELNYESPTQVADLMYDDWKMTPDVRKTKKFKDGLAAPDRSTDKEHIEAAVIKYMDDHDPRMRIAARWLRTLLRMRTDLKNLSTYSESLLAAADDDGRIRAQFLLHGASTGRLSSQGPNLQNQPAVSLVKGEYIERRSGKPTKWPSRKGFGPGPGYVWMEADYSQLELRVAAWLSGDERLRDVFVSGRDIHLEVASTMFSKPPEEISKPERFLAKAVDFGILYGRTGKAISNGTEMDFLERELGGKRWDEMTANAFVAKFLRGYPQLSAWLERTQASAVADMYVETPFGRRRRFLVAPRTKWERWEIGRQATNTPIQSAASDLCLQAMVRISPQLPVGATMLFPVHDSICLEVREDLVDDVSQILRREMELEVGGVPLTIDVETGPTWADIH